MSRAQFSGELFVYFIFDETSLTECVWAFVLKFQHILLPSAAYRKLASDHRSLSHDISRSKKASVKLLKYQSRRYFFISSSVSPIFGGKNSLRIFLNSSDAFFTKLTFPLSSIGAYRAFTTRTQLQRRSSSETSAMELMLSNKDQECFT